MSGWDDPATPVYYEAFCRAHDRYARANAALIAHAGITAGMRVLDVAAGTGRTAEAALARLGDDGRISCVEPAAAMRATGRRRLGDPRVAWCGRLAEAAGPFDRILCGAAIWQMTPLDATIRELSRLLAPGGALCFNIPALYLCEPDEPGGGGDPLLLALPARLAAEAAGEAETAEPLPPLARGAVDAWLEEAGLNARSWSFRVRLTQAAYAEWLKIPVVNGRLLSGLAPGERARRIDVALAAVDQTGWKWERWRGWTASKS